jgi:hypothetical protein
MLMFSTAIGTILCLVAALHRKRSETRAASLYKFSNSGNSLLDEE